MNAAFVSEECNGEQNEHYDQDDALFVLRKVKNPEQTFYSVWHTFGIRYVGRLTASIICHVERSETFSDYYSVGRVIKLIRDSSLGQNDTGIAFHFCAYRIGSVIPASRKPLSRRRQESHSPHARPSGVGS